jgi:chemotaxis protein CheD
MVAAQTLVGIGEIHVIHGDATFACLGLGSCVGLCISDGDAKVSGVAHVMLPQAFDKTLSDRPAKFADTGFYHFLDVLEGLGADRTRMKAVMVGGAQVLHSKTINSVMEFGARNTQMLRELLNEQGIPLVASDVGGNQGRSMIYDTRTGRVTVRTMTEPDKVVCDLV